MNNEVQMRLGKGFEKTINPFTYSSSTAITNTTDVVLNTASTTMKNCLKGIQIYNSHATVATVVVVKDGSTVIWTGYVPAVNGKNEIIFDIPLKGTINTALNFACIATGSNVYISAQGYQI